MHHKVQTTWCIKSWLRSLVFNVPWKVVQREPLFLDLFHGIFLNITKGRTKSESRWNLATWLFCHSTDLKRLFIGQYHLHWPWEWLFYVSSGQVLVDFFDLHRHHRPRISFLVLMGMFVFFLGFFSNIKLLWKYWMNLMLLRTSHVYVLDLDRSSHRDITGLQSG